MGWLQGVTATGLMALSLGPSTATAQTSGHSMVHANGAVMYHAPQWSPDGRWVVVSANHDGDSEVYLARADGGELRQLTHNAVPDDNAQWSLDGSRIRFESDRSGARALYSMRPDGTDVRPEPRDSVVSRSPDGKTLLFESVRDGRGQLFLMTAGRTDARPIATARHAEQGSFSPDGRRIVFEQRSAMHDDIPHSQIVVAHADGSEPYVAASGTDPSWSPDGRLILFKVFDDPTQQLWISTVSPDGTGLRRLAPGVHPDWSPDGSRIVYMRDRADGGTDVWIMNRDGRGDRCLTCRTPFR